MANRGTTKSFKGWIILIIILLIIVLIYNYRPHWIFLKKVPEKTVIGTIKEKSLAQTVRRLEKTVQKLENAFEAEKKRVALQESRLREEIANPRNVDLLEIAPARVIEEKIVEPKKKVLSKKRKPVPLCYCPNEYWEKYWTPRG